MTIASGSTPTTSARTPSPGAGPSAAAEYELEAGLRPQPARTPSSRSRRSYPFPSIYSLDASRTNLTTGTPGTPTFPLHSLSTIPSSSYASAPPLTPDEVQASPTNNNDETTSPRHQKSASLSMNTDTSYTYTSTGSVDPDPTYSRLLFDYRILAQSMHAYRHISIFRRFGRLSMANLLFYQNELQTLETSLQNLDIEERSFTSSASSNLGDEETTRRADERKETRLKLMHALRETLKNYYEALLLQEQVFTSLEPPRPQDSKLLAQLEDPSLSPSSPINPIRIHNDDLVALGLGDRDDLEKVVGRAIPSMFPQMNPSAEDLRHRHVNSKDIVSIFSPFTRRVTRLVIAVVTAALILGPMAILQFLGDQGWKLVCISCFTVTLSVLVALGTRGKGESIVMIIAAFAAVLVVFMGSPA